MQGHISPAPDISTTLKAKQEAKLQEQEDNINNIPKTNKATNKDPYTGDDYDQEWLDMKLVRQYGRTQYVGHVDYEFESDDAQVGARVNILF